jgi:hypothetical protein
MGMRFRTNSEGIGDIKVAALYRFFERTNHRVHFNLGLSFPSGSIEEKGSIHAGHGYESENHPQKQRLSYPMQLGSGIVDMLPGITYIGRLENWSWGAQAISTIRLGENGNNYRLGNRFRSTFWGARNWSNWFSTSARLEWQIWGNIKGADPSLNPEIDPTADPRKQGGSRIDTLLGFNFSVPVGPALIKGQNLAVEIGFPVYQSLDGPQLETDWILTLGWRYSWSF